jgi:DNA-binding NtrC family response regulator
VRYKIVEPISVLIIESSSGIRDYLAALAEINGYGTRTLPEKRELLAELDRHPPDLVLLGPSNHSGQIKALSEVLEREKSGTPILAILEDKTRADGEEVPRKAHLFYLQDGFDTDELKQSIEQIVQDSRDSDYKELDGVIVGQTQAMVQLKRYVVRLAKSDIPILITGESGTGKELVARAIHRISNRAGKPFVKVNSAALPTNLLESELFGFEKGAFTGAYNKKPGKFELAHCGTILLDEIGEIPLPMQAKLLQVLQDYEYSALGSTVNTRVDSRVMAATNNDLAEMVSHGRFRSDLFYRLNVVSIHVPALRERKEDIDLLCEHFLRQYSNRYGREYETLDSRIRQQFFQYSWPGNVRELESFLQSMTVLGHKKGFSEKMTTNGLSSPFYPNNTEGAPLHPDQDDCTSKSSIITPCSLKRVCKKAVRKAETEAIMDVLFHTRWNRRKAAVHLEISYKALLNKIREYSIEDRYQESGRKDEGADEHETGLST